MQKTVDSVQEESDPVDDKTDEDEDNNNNESSKTPSNANVFSVLETATECLSLKSPRLVTSSRFLFFDNESLTAQNPHSSKYEDGKVKQVFLVCSERSDNEQRWAIRFCLRLGHNATETFATLQQTYGNSVLSRAQVFRWFKAFSEGRESIEDEPRSGRSSVSKTAENVVRVRDPVRSDRRLTNIPVAPQPPYSPDLSPCDVFLFPKLKNHLKGHHFGTLENIQTAVTDQLKAIPISEFHQCYEEWKKRLQRCVASERSYFEGDNVELKVY
ncbi:putative mariner transposase [Trichonephila clavipes]|nr:putative mariner transposase [Trichonephila clavipes]